MARRPFRPERGLLCLCVIAALLAGCRENGGDRPGSSELLREAESHVAAGEYSAAEQLYRQALQSLPDDPQPAMQLARLYRTWGRPEDGLGALDEAARRGSPAEEVEPLRLALLAQSGQWEQVRREAEARLEASPEDGPALKLLTEALLQQGECADAVEIAAHWREAAPDDPDAAKVLGSLTGDFAALCEVDPPACAGLQDCGDACDLRLGGALVRANAWPLAACVLARAEASDPSSAEAHAWLGEALARTGRAAEAQKHLEQATLLAPESPLAWLLLGTFYLRQGQNDAARQALLRAQSLDPGNPAPCLAVAEVKAQAGRYDEVDAWTEAALERAPGDVEIWKAVARFYLERNLIQGGFPSRAVDGAVNLAPNDAEAQLLLGWARLIYGDAPGAVFVLNKALALDPRLAEAHYLQGVALKAMGEPEKAQAAFVKAADLGYRP
jgi:tetratricopeptide (TPR) repeat protein